MVNFTFKRDKKNRLTVSAGLEGEFNVEINESKVIRDAKINAVRKEVEKAVAEFMPRPSTSAHQLVHFHHEPIRWSWGDAQKFITNLLLEQYEKELQ